jgi:hypothetical protein
VQSDETQQQLYAGLGRVGGPAQGGTSGRSLEQQRVAGAAAVSAADALAIGQHQEAV